MRLTPKTKKFLDKQFKLYSKRLGVPVPLSLFIDYELSGMIENHKEFQYVKLETISESWHHKDTGLDYDIVYINVENSDFLWQLIDAVVHELLHLKEPKLRHGSKFQDKVNDIIIGIYS